MYLSHAKLVTPPFTLDWLDYFGVEHKFELSESDEVANEIGRAAIFPIFPYGSNEFVYSINGRNRV